MIVGFVVSSIACYIDAPKLSLERFKSGVVYSFFESNAVRPATRAVIDVLLMAVVVV
jgi:hypothetical protein